MRSSIFSFEPKAWRLLGRFLVFAGLFVLGTAAAHFCLGALSRRGRLGTHIDKAVRLDAISSRNKLVLIGGSNLHYGIDSERLEELLHRPVANMGLQGSIGLDFWVRSVEDSLIPGDWVVVAPEPASLCGMAPTSGQSALHALAGIDPAAYRHYTPSQWWSSIRLAGPALQRNAQAALGQTLRSVTGKTQLRHRSNDWGDFEGHRGRQRVFKSKGPLPCPELSSAFADRFREYQARAEARGVRFMLAIAPTADSSFGDGLARTLADASSELDALHLPYRHPDQMFYDTTQHLLFEHRRGHTEALARSIQAAIALQP